LGVRVAMGPLVLTIAAALLTWILLNGANPIHLTAQEGQPQGCLTCGEQTRKPLFIGLSRGFWVFSAWFGLLAGSS
jgi:hypothetical protein